jgi:hypothetical protein
MRWYNLPKGPIAGGGNLGRRRPDRVHTRIQGSDGLASLTDLAKLSHLIEAFVGVYQVQTVVGIRVPTGWLGKPFDSYYTLTSTAVEPTDNKLLLDLSHGWFLSITALRARLSENMRELTVAVESGEMVAIGARQRFGSGDIMFCVAESPYASAALSTNSALLQPFIQ